MSIKSMEITCYRKKMRSSNTQRDLLLKNSTPRIVPPFSIQSLQKNTQVMPQCCFNEATTTPTTATMTKATTNLKSDRILNKRSKGTSFRMYYERGDLPIKMEYLSGGWRISWTLDADKLDFNLYLPLFFDGLSETEHPYKTYARQGVRDLIHAGGDKIYPVIPQLIIPIKNALNTKNKEVMCVTLKILQELVKASDLIGPALVPFYRQLLPMFNAYKVHEVNCGDKIDYAQMKNNNLSALIEETLQVMERHGGEDAFINIKYMVPTYESCLLN